MLSLTVLQKGLLLLARPVAPGPPLCFFEPGTTIEPLSGPLPLLPLRDIFAQGALKQDVAAGLSQPLCQAYPLSNQRLVTHFNGGFAGDLVRGQQARSDECLQRLSHLLCLHGIGWLELGMGRTAARGILLGCSRLDQAQKYITRRLAMRVGRQCLVGLLGMLRQCSFDAAHLVISLQGQLVAVAPLKQLIERKL